jgi:predicted nucleic-acid-binding Zn-ribbon protein/peroxiredoxin
MTAPEMAKITPLTAPSLELADAAGAAIKLDSLWQAKPLVLAVLGDPASGFYNDLACALRDSGEVLRKAGAEIAAIADAASAELTGGNLRYTRLIDAEHRAAEALGLGREQAGCFVIDTRGMIRFAHRNAGEGDNPSIWTIVDEVCSITGATVERPSLKPKDIFGDERATVGEQLKTRPLRPRAGFFSEPTIRLQNYKCAKCGHTACDVRRLHTVGGWLSRFYNFQYRQFSAVICEYCSYTELYKSEPHALANVLDFLMGA